MEVYVGPYLSVTGKKKEVVEREIRTCSNKKCETYRLNQEYIVGQNFCAECGSEVGVKKYKEKLEIDSYDLLYSHEKFSDELWGAHYAFSKNSDIWIPNSSTPYCAKRESESLIDLTGVDINSEIEWMKKKYNKVIQYLQSELGENSVEVKWGVVDNE